MDLVTYRETVLDVLIMPEQANPPGYVTNHNYRHLSDEDPIEICEEPLHTD
jgi:hypothetical protein